MSIAMANFHCIVNLARPWCCYWSKFSRDVAIKVFLKGDYHLKWWTLSRIAYIMQVGFIQSVEGLKRRKKKNSAAEQNSVCTQDFNINSSRVFQCAGLPLRFWTC